MYLTNNICVLSKCTDNVYILCFTMNVRYTSNTVMKITESVVKTQFGSTFIYKETDIYLSKVHIIQYL
jgi:hypothetical protein